MIHQWYTSVMKELRCDGSGRLVYYKERGRSYLLCEAVEPHVHCYCGNPMSKDLNPRQHHCTWCVRRKNGQRLHRNATVRESNDHMFTTLDVESKGGTSNLIGNVPDEVHREVEEEVFAG